MSLFFQYLELRHKFIRMWYKLMCKSNYSVISDFKPFIEIKNNYNFTYDVFYNKKFLFKSKSFDDLICNSEDLVIIGSGPSVSNLDLNKIENRKCILLNGAISLLKDYNLNVIAYVVIDPKFFEKRFEFIRYISNSMNLIINPAVVRAISERDINFFSNKNVFLTQDIIEPSYYVNNTFDYERRKAEKSFFSYDLNYGYIDAKTVMSVAMQFSYNLNIKNIYLVGLDLTNTQTPRFYENKDNIMKSDLENSYEYYIYPFMKSAAGIFKEKGINVYNLSKKTRLPYEVFPYSDIFEGKE